MFRPVPGLSASLQDVLPAIPLDVVDLHLWRLLPHSDRVSLRQACPTVTPGGVRHLTEQLIISATHDLRPAARPLAGGEAEDSDDDGFSNGEQHGAGTQPWQSTADAQAAFLSRLPCLNKLQLQAWVNEGDLVHTLQGYSPAMGHRIQQLTLAGGPLTLSGMYAVRAACPNLQELTVCTDVPGRTGPSYVALSGSLFLPLHGVSLTKLEVSVARLSRDALQSLAGLSRLQHLHLDVAGCRVGHLLRAGSLPDLTHLSLRFTDGHGLHLVCIEAVMSLTRLTHLSIPPLASGAFEDEEAFGALLGCLTRLRSLDLSRQIYLGSTNVDALASLTALTALTFCGILELHPLAHTKGCLPLLQRLCLGEDLLPADLIHTLAPLLPLPALTHLLTGGSGEGDVASRLSVSLHEASSETAAAELRALHAVATVLAEAPHLNTLHTVCLRGFQVPFTCLPWPVPLTIHPVVETLAPLAGQLTHLTLARWTGAFDAQWGELGRLLPVLADLTLEDGEVGDGGLVWLAGQLPTLRRMGLLRCRGYSTQGCQQAQGVCWGDLVVTVLPRSAH